MSTPATQQTIVVIGGGIAGMTAALEAAECGAQVVLVERSASLGGRTAMLYRYFPKLCHPLCGLEINLRRLRGNPGVRVLTLAEVLAVTGQKGNYRVRLRIRPRYVNDRCTACGECAKVVSREIPNPFNQGLDRIKAVYLPHALAHPQRYVLDASLLGHPEAEAARAVCPAGAIDLDMKEEVIELAAGSIIWATGWKPYDAAKIQPYGYGRFADVVTSVEFERLADPRGPTRGKILRPSNGEPASNIAFIQCAGSRDENHLRHCSRVCCMVSLKQTQYLKEAAPEGAQATVYYIDIRAIDRFEHFYQQVRADAQVKFVKSKVARIAQNRQSGQLVLHGVDTEGYRRYAVEHDLVVLAIGMEPETRGLALPADLVCDASGFIEDCVDGGQFSAGVAAGPLDVNRAVQSATAAALRALQVARAAAGAEGGAA